MSAQTSLIGRPVRDLETPVLLVDLDALERNIGRMCQVIIAEAGVGWRPHTKGIKVPALAHKLLRAGALGITCAKIERPAGGRPDRIRRRLLRCDGVPA